MNDNNNYMTGIERLDTICNRTTNLEQKSACEIMSQILRQKIHSSTSICKQTVQQVKNQIKYLVCEKKQKKYEDQIEKIYNSLETTYIPTNFFGIKFYQDVCKNSKDYNCQELNKNLTLLVNNNVKQSNTQINDLSWSISYHMMRLKEHNSGDQYYKKINFVRDSMKHINKYFYKNVLNVSEMYRDKH